MTSYAYLAEMCGRKELVQDYMEESRKRIIKWEKENIGCREQRHELIWDQILDFGIFSCSGAVKDTVFNYARTNELMWEVVLADSKEIFVEQIMPVYRFVNETSNRFPMFDRAQIKKGKEELRVEFEDRSVVGGYFVKMLKESFYK